MKAASAAGSLDDYMKYHGDIIAALAKKDKGFAAKLHPVLAEAALGGGAGGVMGFLNKAADQIVQGLVHSPGALVTLGKTVVKGDVGVLTGNDKKITEANAEFGPMVKGTVASVKQDVLHPKDRPGFLFLDILGLASPAARLAAGGRALALGEGLNAAELAVTKKAGGTVAIGREGAKENALLSESPAVAALQKWNLSRRQKNLDAAIAGSDAPAGLRSILLPQFAQDFLDKTFSFERKIGRESDARQRVQHIVDTSLGNELNHVAGGLVVQSRVLSRLPSRLRTGLSRGEQKAIQTLSFGVKPDEQIAFHQQMIKAGFGDAKDHLRQITDLGLAKKVLANPNPSGRFGRAVELTQQVVAETQRKKIEDLGLSPVTAEVRVGKPAGAMGNVADGQSYPATGTVQPFYSKLETRTKPAKRARGGYFASRPSKFGEGPPVLPPELTNEFTGSSIVNGKFSIDATGLTTQAMARTVRAVNVLAEHDKHWNAGTDLPRSKWDMPVRDKKAIPEKLRNALSALEDNAITPVEAAKLPPDMRDVLKELYVSPEDFAKQYGELSGVTEPIDGIKFFDRRSIGSASNLGAPAGGQGAMKVLEVINEPFRDLTLFVRPAYALNALGNAGMLVFDEGFTAIPNVAWALRAKSALGAEAHRVLVDLGGTGKAQSYASGLTPKPGRVLASGWNIVTDRAFRVAAIRHYARKLGYTTDEQFRDLLLSGGPDLVQAARRGNKSLVEFDNMTAIEKDYLRHIVFVYPWVSRSVVYSLRAVMEHPLETDVLAHLGQQEADSDPIFNQVPEWFKRTGYFPIGWTADGKPKVANPTSINSFSTLGDLMGVGRAGISGAKYDSFENLLGPGFTFAVHAITGRDQYGNKYAGSQLVGAMMELVNALPQVSASARASKVNPPLKPINVEDRASLESRFNSALKRVVFSPGWLDGFGSLIAGGLSPRAEDKTAAAARYWRDQPPEARHTMELWFLNKALDVQGKLLKQKAPAAVRDGVKVASDLTFEYSRFSSEHGRTPTEKERAQFAIDYVLKRGSLSEERAAKFTSQLAPMVDPQDIKTLTSKVVGDYGNGNAVKQWDLNVRLVASFKAPVFAEKTSMLHAQGLIGSVPKASQTALYDYGRKYLAFKDAVEVLGKKVKAGTATRADLQAFEDKNDKPVNGLPSFVRTAWGYNTPDQQKQAVVGAVKGSWSGLSVFEKELLGHKVDARVSEAWATFGDNVAKGRASLPAGKRQVSAKDKLGYAKQLDAYYGLKGEFVKDYQFSRQPLFSRVSTEKPVKESPNGSDWRTVLDTAKKAWQLHKTSPDSFGSTSLKDQWHDYVLSPGFQSWLDSRPKFKSEIAAYGGSSFLVSLL